MGYDLSVERYLPGEPRYDSQVPITRDEFIAVVEQMPFLRLTEKDPYIFTDPNTGHSISVSRDPDRASEGARVELFFSRENAWHWIFTYGNGTVSFRAPDSYPPGDPVWQAAKEIAQRLVAQIVGQDGEVYSLESGDVIGELG